MEAIAMKCTQEEFDSIKDKLSKFKIEESLALNKFYPYLTNEYICEMGYIGASNSTSSRKIYEYFDEDILLKACDIEVEKPIMQVWFDGRWVNYSGKYRVKPQPDYNKEIESLQEKAKINGMKAVITFEKI